MLIWIILASPYVALLGMILWDSRETKNKPVKGLATLITIAICVLCFYPQIADVISRTKTIKIDVSKRVVEAEFAETVQRQLAQIGDLERDTQVIVGAASSAPDKSIALAWVLIERKIKRLFLGTFADKWMMLTFAPYSFIVLQKGMKSSSLVSKNKRSTREQSIVGFLYQSQQIPLPTTFQSRQFLGSCTKMIAKCVTCSNPMLDVDRFCSRF